MFREVNKKNEAFAEGVLEKMVFHVFGVRLTSFIVQFSYMCTQEDAYSMY